MYSVLTEIYFYRNFMFLSFSVLFLCDVSFGMFQVELSHFVLLEREINNFTFFL